MDITTAIQECDNQISIDATHDDTGMVAYD